VNPTKTTESAWENPPLHRMYHHYSEMPYSERVLYTAVLLLFGLGYLFALANIYDTYAGRAGGNPLILSYRDIVVGYSGTGQASTLEGALGGPMRGMLPADERSTIINWLHQGTKPDVFQKDVKPIIEKRCLVCHGGSNPHIPNLSTTDGVKQVTATDTGPPISRLVLVSHIHLFGMSFIFFIMGFMFSHAYVRPVWLKCSIIALPFVAIATDISSWYLVRVFHPFALVVIGGGMTMAACFAFMWIVTMYQMWLSNPPRAVLERDGTDTGTS
jgi:hypothetical protein